MSQTGDKSDKKRGQYAFNLTLAAVAGQVGCLTTIIVVIAVLAGLWLDNYFDTRPLFIIILIAGSVPVTLITMFWVVRKATSHMTTNMNIKSQETKEAVNRGRNG